MLCKNRANIGKEMSKHWRDSGNIDENWANVDTAKQKNSVIDGWGDQTEKLVEWREIENWAASNESSKTIIRISKNWATFNGSSENWGISWEIQQILIYCLASNNSRGHLVTSNGLALFTL
jgi:hypothetical protein